MLGMTRSRCSQKAVERSPCSLAGLKPGHYKERPGHYKGRTLPESDWPFLCEVLHFDANYYGYNCCV